jgi:hypothetical protein
MTWEETKKLFRITIEKRDDFFNYDKEYIRKYIIKSKTLNTNMQWLVRNDTIDVCFMNGMTEEELVARRIIKEFQLEKYLGEQIQIN